MFTRTIRAFTLGLLLALPTVASADSASEGDITLTGNQSSATFGSDNVVGSLKDGGTGIGGAKITIYDPDGNEIGSGTTGTDGSYDIDTSLNSVGGMTLTFNVVWGKDGEGSFATDPELTMGNTYGSTPGEGRGKGHKGR